MSHCSTCACALFWVLHPGLNPARIQGHCCWLCWPPRTASFSWAIRHAELHFMAGLFLDWDKREEDGLLPATPAVCISTTRCSRPDEQCRHYWGWATSIAFWHGQGCSGFTGVSGLCCLQRCPSLQSVIHWYPPHSFFCVHLGIHKRCREMGKWQTKLSCLYKTYISCLYKSIASVKLIQELILKTQRERWRDSRQEETAGTCWHFYEPASFPSLRVCECVSTHDGNL